MQSNDNGKPDRLVGVVTNAGAVVAALWLLAYLVPVAHDMMLDVLLAFLVGLMVTGLLGWAATRSARHRRFWGLLAAAWAVALMGNIAWGVYEMVTGQKLPLFSLVDGLYLVRYVLVLLAFWPTLARPARRQWGNLLTVVLVATVVMVIVLFLSPVSGRDILVHFLAGALYPILDVGLLYVVWEVWRCEEEGRFRNALGFLALALVAYGVANWFNFYGRIVSYAGLSALANLFWPLSDILTGIAALHVLWMASVPARTGIDDGLAGGGEA